MCLFRIVGGKLVPINPDFEDFYDVHNALGHVDAGEPVFGDVAVVVADARRPLRRVPKNALTVTTVNETDNDVYLFWAVNEDDDNKEVIVAFDNWDVANNYDDLWRVIGFNEWVQLPMNKELIRAFQSVEEARACIHGDGLVFIPVEMREGWQGVRIHGHDSPWNNDAIHDAEDRRLVEMVPIPSGWSVHKTFDGDDIPLLHQVLSESEADHRLPMELKNAQFVRVVITADGGAAVIVRFRESEYGGTVIVGKTFTHEEAKTMLAL